MNEKVRLLRVLRGEKADRPPVICPGGMMSACVTELLQDIKGDHNTEPKVMAEVSRRINELTGFENYGVPYSMVIEALPLGCRIFNGSKVTEERIAEYNNEPLDVIMKKYKVVPESETRMKIVLDSIKELKNDTVPVIGSITGHISTAASAVDPLIILKMVRKDPERLYDFLKFINYYLIQYASDMVRYGADVISIADPTATGEILGAKNFERFAVPFYRELINAIHKLNIPVIIHICGNAESIIASLDSVHADALSFDSAVNMKLARKSVTTRLMGNVSTQLLHDGEKEKIVSITKNCIGSGVDIVSPACGLSMATPIANLRALTDYVKGLENG